VVPYTELAPNAACVVESYVLREARTTERREFSSRRRCACHPPLKRGEARIMFDRSRRASASSRPSRSDLDMSMSRCGRAGCAQRQAWASASSGRSRADSRAGRIAHSRVAAACRERLHRFLLEWLQSRRPDFSAAASRRSCAFCCASIRCESSGSVAGGQCKTLASRVPCFRSDDVDRHRPVAAPCFGSPKLLVVLFPKHRRGRLDHVNSFSTTVHTPLKKPRRTAPPECPPARAADSPYNPGLRIHFAVGAGAKTMSQPLPPEARSRARKCADIGRNLRAARTADD